jgi:predicted RNA methylase
VADLGIGCGILTIAAAAMGAAAHIGFDIDEEVLAQTRTNLAQFELEDSVQLVCVDIAELYEGLGGEPLPEPNYKNSNHKHQSNKSTRGGRGKKTGGKGKGRKGKGGKKAPVDDKKTTALMHATAFQQLLQTVYSRSLQQQPLRAPRVIDTVVSNPPFGTRRAGIDLLFVRTGLLLAKNAVYSLHKTSTRPYIVKQAENWGVDCKVLAQMQFDIPKMYTFHTSKTKDIEVDLIRFSHRIQQQHPEETAEETAAVTVAVVQEQLATVHLS